MTASWSSLRTPPSAWPLDDYLGDTILDLEPTPNRSDWLSVLGVAYEVAALTGSEVRQPEAIYPEEGQEIRTLLSVGIRDTGLCPRYTASLIRGIAVGPSPRWLQKRLEQCDVRPINNVVDVTNYVMLEYGQPLHAFDYETLLRRRIHVRRAYTGETMTTLDEIEIPLGSDHLVIADDRDARGFGRRHRRAGQRNHGGHHRRSVGVGQLRPVQQPQDSPGP